MRVFVYEYLSGGGLIADDPAATEALLPLGLSMRNALAADLLRSDACDLTVASSALAGRVPLPAMETRPAYGESPFDFVARQAALHDAAWVIAPETGGLLERMQRVVGPQRWIGCTGPAIALATGKRATLDHLRAQGIATPFDAEHAALATAWVVKPDDGAGSVDTHVHERLEHALAESGRHALAGRQMTVEPFVEGEALSLSLACGADACELLSINRQRIRRSAGGALSFGGVEVNALPMNDARSTALRLLAASVAEAIDGLRGFVGIDVVWHPQRGPVVIEVNPRVTCALVGLSAALARNVGAELLFAWQAERSVSHA